MILKGLEDSSMSSSRSVKAACDFSDANSGIMIPPSSSTSSLTAVSKTCKQPFDQELLLTLHQIQEAVKGKSLVSLQNKTGTAVYEMAGCEEDSGDLHLRGAVSGLPRMVARLSRTPFQKPCVPPDRPVE